MPEPPERANFATMITMNDEALLASVSLDPSPVIEAYKKDVDRTLIRENLRLSVEERAKKMIAALHFAEQVRGSRKAAR